MVFKLSSGYKSGMTSCQPEVRAGVEARVESQGDLGSNTQEVTIPDVEHVGFCSRDEDVVFFLFQSISKTDFVPKGWNHPRRIDPFLLPLPGCSNPKSALPCAPRKVPRDEGFMSHTSGRSPATTEESEHFGL